MATQGVGQPSTKKRSFLLRDIFKICRSISSVLPREKPNHKHERKLHTESKRHEDHKSNVTNQPNAFNFQVMILQDKTCSKFMEFNGSRKLLLLTYGKYFLRKPRLLRWKVRVFARFLAIIDSTAWDTRSHYLYQEVIATTRPQPRSERVHHV